MSPRRSRTRRSGNGSTDDPETIISGSIRSPDETDALAVKLTLSAGMITMRADGTVLGSWPSTAVTIQSIDAESFEFAAEGDLLILVPDEPNDLHDHPLVTKPEPPQKNRKERRPQKKKKQQGTKKPKKEKPKKEPKEPKEKKTKTIKKTKKTNEKQKPKEKKEEPKEKRASMWIRSLDTARRYDIFGLDRVPVDPNLRGTDHQHTWDHRVVAGSGPGRHICTICGRIRARAR